jgi:ABC-type amino acid transport substrate-binding protein
MAHHSGPDGEAMKGLMDLFKRQDDTDAIGDLMESLRLGATGRFPKGTLTDDDEGELRFGLAATGGKVVLAFGKPVDWIGFDAEQARSIAQQLLDKAEECDGIASVVRRTA